jgi:hypothetical protein
MNAAVRRLANIVFQTVFEQGGPRQRPDVKPDRLLKTYVITACWSIANLSACGQNRTVSSGARVHRSAIELHRLNSSVSLWILRSFSPA